MSVQQFLKDPKLDWAKIVREAERINREYNACTTLGLAEQRSGPLKGLPISVKDNICVKGMPATAGSRILQNYVPPFDATCIARLRLAGASFISKTNMDEFGFGSFGIHSGFGASRNPWDPERVAGGSSSGSGAFTAAATFPHVAIAESTGGSISAPAAFCGVVGFTPTYGLVSRYGLIDYANSLDKIGIMSKSVSDVALALSIIGGKDPRDQTSHGESKTYTTKETKGLTIGIPKEYFEGLSPDIEDRINEAIGVLENNGFKTVKVSLPHTKYALSSYYIIAMSEASTNLAKFSGMRYGASAEIQTGESFNKYFTRVRTANFGSEAKRRILLGTFARMAGYRDQYYLKALRVRTIIIEDFKKAFKKADVLAAPTMPMIAPRLDELKNITPVEEYLSDILTVPVNLAGMPHASLPAGFVNKMPVGLHLIADHNEEQVLLNTSHTYEKLVRDFAEVKV